MNIYIAKNNARQGPYTADQVVDIVRRGDVLMSDLAWREGMADWQPIHSIQDIVEAVLPPMPVNATEPVQTSPPPIPPQLVAAPPTIHASSSLGASSQPEVLALCLQSCRGILGSTVNMFLDGELKNGNFTFKDKDTLLTRPLLGFGKPRTIEFPISDVVNVRQTDAMTLSFDLAKAGKIYRRRYVVNALNAQNASILINLFASTIGLEFKTNRIRKFLATAFCVWLIVHGIYMIYQAIRG